METVFRIMKFDNPEEYGDIKEQLVRYFSRTGIDTDELWLHVKGHMKGWINQKRHYVVARTKPKYISKPVFVPLLMPMLRHA